MSKARELAAVLAEKAAALGGLSVSVDFIDRDVEVFTQAAAELNRLAEVERLFEQHKDNWLAWQDKRARLEKAAAELERMRARGPAATVKVYPSGASVSWSIGAIHGLAHDTHLYALEEKP